jgi:hypothetical protein
VVSIAAAVQGPINEGNPIMTRALDVASVQRRRRTEAVIDYETAVAEGKEILAKIDSSLDRLMRLGELADEVEKGYGEGRLNRFATEIGIAACTLERCRSVFRAWPKQAPAPKSYAVAQELQAHPDRFEIIRRNPDMTKREARQMKRRYDREKKSAPDYLRENTNRWFKDVVRRAGETIRDASVADGEVLPNHRRAMREVVEPKLLPTLRDAAEALVRLAAYLEQLTQEDEPLEEATLEGETLAAAG